MEIMDDKINDVDEIFESFVKKKLKQLGIKRAASKSLDGTMNELERNIKSRLEKNLTLGLGGFKEETAGSESTVLKNNQEKKKLKKEKKYHKKKKDKHKSKNKTKTSKRDVESNVEFSNKILLDKSIESPLRCKNPAEEQTIVNGFSPLNGVSKTKQISENKIELLEEKIEVNGDDPQIQRNGEIGEESNSLPTDAPKKDIASIRRKIELLKAKSAEDERMQKVTIVSELKESEEESKISKADKKSERRERGSRKRSRSRSERSKHRSRSRSPRRKHRSHRRSRSRSRSRSGSRSHHKSRTHSRSHHSHKSSRKERRDSSQYISSEDKVRLLEIAKANALAQHKASYMGATMSSVGQMVKNTSMSVHQLTAICKEISADNIEATPLTKEGAEKLIEEAEAGKMHHPFSVRDLPISINIKAKSSMPLPPPVSKPVAVLSKEFPVSCGQQHRRKEVLETVYGKWEAVAKDEATINAVQELVSSDKVFIDPEPAELDVSSVIADRISAVRQLQENPTDVEARTRVETTQQRLDEWTKSKQVPGQFTGSTALQPMPKEQLEGGRQAWFKQEDLQRAKHVGGIGKCLLQKMGWKPGTPLGKTMLGQLEPLTLNVKSDRKGLSSFMEAGPSSKKSKSAGQSGQGLTVKDLSSKHPVSALMEICSKRRWQLPQFSLVDPADHKSFTFKVIIQQDEFIGQPATNKKLAKFKAATVVLQSMGLIPKT